MTAITRSLELLVNTTLPFAFEYVADLARHPEWNDGLKIEALTPDPIRVGKEYASHGKVAVQENRPNIVRISQYEPPHRFAFVAADPNFGDVVHEFNFTKRTDGVLITRSMTVQLNPIMAVLFKSIVYPLIGRPSMNKSFADLKAKLQSR